MSAETLTLPEITAKVRSRTPVATFFVTIVFLIGTGAFSGVSSATVRPEKKIVYSAPTTITFGYSGAAGSTPCNDYASYGFMDKLERQFHTTVENDYFSSVTSVVSALLAGSVQYVDFTPTQLFDADIEGTGSNLVALYQLGQGGEELFFAKIADRSRGTGINALKNYGVGSTWGLPSVGGAVQLAVNLALNSVGVSWQHVTEEGLGASALGPTVAAGKVDIAASTPSVVEPLVQSGQAYVVWYSSGLQAYRITGDYPSGELYTEKTFIAQYPALTQAVINAELKTTQFFQSNFFRPDVVYNGLSTAAKSITTLSQWKQEWPYVRDMNGPLTGLITSHFLTTDANINKQFGFLPATFQVPAGSTNTTFLTNAYLAEGKKPPSNPVFKSLLYILGNKYTPLGS